jgi:hypothetical protein
MWTFETLPEGKGDIPVEISMKRKGMGNIECRDHHKCEY